MLIFTVFAMPLVIFGAAESSMVRWPEYESPNSEKPSEENTVEEHHVYYNSTLVTSSDVIKKEWVHFDAMKNANFTTTLSDSRHRAADIRLLFKFPFYGQELQILKITTGGFLLMGEYMRTYMANTRYVAPLMADFDPSLSNNSFIKYYDNGTAFTVQWEKLKLEDRPEAGEFTFQATLHQSGDIVFAYLHIPMWSDSMIRRAIKIGLSDAHIVEKNIFFVTKKIFYQYHRVQVDLTDVHTSTVIYLKALPTCNALKDCASCTTTKIGFKCSWCESEERCSDGMDRKRLDWLSKKCHLSNSTEVNQCPVQALTTSTTTFKPPLPSSIESSAEQSVEPGHHLIVAYIIADSLVCLVLVLAGWAIYAYSTPDSPSGRFLYRMGTRTLGRHSTESTAVFAGGRRES